MPAISLIDTHCHLNFHQYDKDREAVIQRAADSGVRRVIVPAVDLKSCQQALRLAESYRGIYAAVGIHPNSSRYFNAAVAARIREWAAHRQTVAIGEIGLDYYWGKSPKHIQRQAFEQQLDLAGELELPVIIHNRDANEDVLAVLKAWISSLPASRRNRPGALHSFSAPSAVAERALALGFYLGFTGPITFKKAEHLRTLVKTLPRDRLLIETDSPFLAPHPHRGKRNEPAYVGYVNQKLAELQGISAAEMAVHTTANAEHLFALPAQNIDGKP